MVYIHFENYLSFDFLFCVMSEFGPNKGNLRKIIL